jgi:hypothetical protein
MKKYNLKWILLACYCIAAAIQTAYVLIAKGPPHAGYGPLIVGGALTFFATPLVAIQSVFSDGFVGVAVQSLLVFFGVFICGLLIVYGIRKSK